MIKVPVPAVTDHKSLYIYIYIYFYSYLNSYFTRFLTREKSVLMKAHRIHCLLTGDWIKICIIFDYHKEKG